MIKKSMALSLAAMILATPAMASNYGVQLRGNVPVSCHVKSDASIVDITDTTADLGIVREFCNNAAGYDLYLDYSPELAGGTVTIGDRMFQLDGAGTVAIASENGPSIQANAVRLDLANAADNQNLAISFRMVPR
uniref:hypothetical protein n=1 Tax=Parerythrobacter lutipelagi TaxID=1964208 RepID=UPI0010FA0616|nr:hypothetical protein [Parerythrobacter lutipelagi]